MRTKMITTMLLVSAAMFAGCSIQGDSEQVDSSLQSILPPSTCGGDELVTRTQGFWKNHTCVLKGDATGYSLVPVSLGASLSLDKPSDVVDYLSTAPRRGDSQLILGHQLLAAKLNASIFTISRFEFADWDGDGSMETVGELIAIGDGVFDSGSSADQLKMATILDKLNNAGDAADLWFDPTCRTPASCD